MSAPSQKNAVPRGRPRSISRELVLETALTHLRESDAKAEISLSRVARDLGVSPAALYRYFPSRDALLNAMSDIVFAGLCWPEDAVTLRDKLRDWQANLASLFEIYPSLIRVTGWDEHLSPAWLKAQMPIAMLLHESGIQGTDLVEVSTWFLAGTLGLLHTHMVGASEVRGPSNRIVLTSSYETLPDDMKAFMDNVIPHMRAADPVRICRAGLDVLVEGVVQRAAALSRSD